MADSSLILIAAFFMWTLFNILCHYFANLFLTTLLAGDQRDKYSPATAALALTVSQAAFCFVFTKNDCSHKSVPVRKTIYLILTLLHILATFTTNYSLSLVDISSTMAVKMAEPISTSFLHCIFLKRQLKVVEFTAVVLIVVGTIGFIYDPTSEYSDVKGAIFAFASNLLYALRNILLKSTGFNTSIKLRHLTEVSVYLICTKCWRHVIGRYTSWFYRHVHRTNVSRQSCNVFLRFHICYIASRIGDVSCDFEH